MREFKFIRGKYTNENIFNSDETKACLFAYDSEGNLVQFTEKNNKEFQDKFAGLSSDDRLSEIYTLRPSQFTVSAKQESSGFDFTYKADETAFNNDVQIPEVVRNNAESHIKSNTEVTFDTGDKHLPNLNFEDSSNIIKTPTTFKFNDNNNRKEFSKNLIFKITGTVKERGYATAQGEGITAYPKSGDKIDFGGETGTNAKSGTFYQGVWQKIAATKTGIIYRNTATVSAKGGLTLAKNYVASDGYRFIKDGKFETDIPYQDGLSFTLYSKVDGYLTAVEANDAATSTKTFNNTSAHKYKINSAGDYELCSSTNASDSVQYYLIQDGSSASKTKLRKSSPSPEKYSVISGDDYYFVDNTTPSKGFSSLGFKDIGNYIDDANASLTAVDLTETKSVGANKVAFIKYGGIWHYANSDVAIMPKFYKTVDGKKVYLSSIKKDGDKYILTGDNNYTDTVAKDSISNAVDGTNYYYSEKLLDDYCEFNATTAESRTVFIKLSSLDKIIGSGAVDDSDFGTIHTPVIAEITTSYTVKTGYVAYDKNETLTELIDKDKNKAYERNEAKEVKSIGSTNYKFYYVNNGTAYMLKGDCNVGARANNQFVEGYAASYENYYIFKNNKLSNISATDLTGTNITYYENNNHNIVGNGVYDDDDDGKKYVMFSENNWVEGIAINSENTLVNENNVPSPNTTEDVLRFITEVNVNATESD